MARISGIEIARKNCSHRALSSLCSEIRNCSMWEGTNDHVWGGLLLGNHPNFRTNKRRSMVSHREGCRMMCWDYGRGLGGVGAVLLFKR